MNDVIPVYKKRGMTPFQAIIEYKKSNPNLENLKISYAGRLDPMAEGLLLLLVGDRVNKERQCYESLEKTYIFEILFGISSDSFDILGIIKDVNLKISGQVTREFVIMSLRKFIGKIIQNYPPYSSASVKGKPLYWYTRRNLIKSITIPKHICQIINLELISLKQTQISENPIISLINKVTGDFRQQEIINKWQSIFTENNQITLPVAKIEMICSSGTYVRQLVNDISEDLEIPALTFNIKRTRVGKYSI